MARSDLLLALVAAARSGDEARITEAILTLAADEDHKRHRVLANQLRDLASDEVDLLPRQTSTSASTPGRGAVPDRDLSSVWLSSGNRQQVDALLDDYRYADALRGEGLRPRSKVVLTGAPGNGKTSLAEALATELRRPLFRVRYETVIGSLLGSTGTELHSLFAEASQQESVLFFDEFEVLAKERADAQEAGEMRRVVSSLMLLLDALPSWVAVVAATNHPEMLDRAIWRRFDMHLDLAEPSQAERARFARNLAKKYHLRGVSRVLRRVTEAGSTSYSSIEAEVLAARRAEIVAEAKAAPQLTDGGTEWQTIT
jgi:SpoVK/Ycf46/Vps4 family AAA+-type ATPase